MASGNPQFTVNQPPSLAVDRFGSLVTLKSRRPAGVDFDKRADIVKQASQVRLIGHDRMTRLGLHDLAGQLGNAQTLQHIIGRSRVARFVLGEQMNDASWITASRRPNAETQCVGSPRSTRDIQPTRQTVAIRPIAASPATVAHRPRSVAGLIRRRLHPTLFSKLAVCIGRIVRAGRRARNAPNPVHSSQRYSRSRQDCSNTLLIVSRSQGLNR